MEKLEELTQFIPIEAKAEMLELEIREYIKAHDPYLFANTSTSAVAIPALQCIVVAVCHNEEIIFRQEYPDMPNICMSGEFADTFTAWRTSRGL
jgi:hypothetical protein